MLEVSVSNMPSFYALKPHVRQTEATRDSVYPLRRWTARSARKHSHTWLLFNCAEITHTCPRLSPTNEQFLRTAAMTKERVSGKLMSVYLQGPVKQQGINSPL